MDSVDFFKMSLWNNPKCSYQIKLRKLIRTKCYTITNNLSIVWLISPRPFFMSYKQALTFKFHLPQRAQKQDNPKLAYLTTHQIQ